MGKLKQIRPSDLATKRVLAPDGFAGTTCHPIFLPR